MPQAITTADVHRGWFDCITCGEILPIFYHQRCPTCHSEFTLLAARRTRNHHKQGGNRLTFLHAQSFSETTTPTSNVFTSVCRTSHLHSINLHMLAGVHTCRLAITQACRPKRSGGRTYGKALHSSNRLDRTARNN